MTARDFRAGYFERRVHLQKAALRECAFAWSDLDVLLHQIEPCNPALQLFHQGLVPEDSYTEEAIELGVRRRRLNKVRFYGLLHKGATVVLNRMENHSIQAKRLCVAVGSFAGLQSTANAYLSFSGRGTFGKHWDTHDVFALQLIGRKRWQVFAPTLPLPLSHQTSEHSPQACPDTPVLDCVLETGDALYIPRGWWHQAIPLDEGSFHLSVGVYAPTVLDYLMWACSRELPPDADVRQAAHRVTSGQLMQIMEKLRAAVLDPVHLVQFQQQLAQRERLASEFNLGAFLDRNVPPLGARTRISLTSCYPPDLRDGLSINGARLQLDALNTAIVQHLTGSALELGNLQQRLSDVPKEAIQRALLDLARHEVVSLETSA